MYRIVLASSLALILTSCVGIPEDELQRLEALELDWLNRPEVEPEHSHRLLELQEIAIRRQPGLTATFHTYQAALQRIILAGALDDPQVRYGYFLDSVETRVGPQNWKAGVSQTFPFWGKRDLRAEVALHEAQELREKLVEDRLGIARDVARAYWDLYYIDHARGVMTRQLDLLEQLASSVETRLTSGRASRADLLTIQMDVDRLHTERSNLENREREATGRLNALLDRGPSEPCPLDFPEEEVPAMPALDRAELVKRARDFGQVRIRAHRVLRQEAAVSLAELGYFPDFSLGYDYISTGRANTSPMMPAVADSGKDPQILGIGFNLPLWWDKNEARVEQAKSLLDAERASRRQLIRDAERGAIRALEAALEAEKNCLLYAEQLMPQAEERLRLSEQDYVTGRVDLDRLIGAEKDVLLLDLKKARAIADREAALADLDYLTAGGLGRMPLARPAGAEDIPEIDAMNTPGGLAGKGDVEP